MLPDVRESVHLLLAGVGACEAEEGASSVGDHEVIRMKNKVLAVAFLGVCAAFSAFGCFNIGNSSGDCDPGEACVCDGIGNCDKACTGKGCEFECSGTGNCTMDCTDGGCSATVKGQGNAKMQCDGNGCSMTCSNTGTCTIMGCTKDCTITCTGTGICEIPDCTDPSCVVK